MKIFGYFLIVLFLSGGCRNPKVALQTHAQFSSTEEDSLQVRNAFEKLKSSPQFLEDLGLGKEEQFQWNTTSYGKIFWGDLNEDDTIDALLAFAIENRGGGNNSDFHYVALFQENNQWEYGGQLDASISADDIFFEADSIVQNKVVGQWKGDVNQSITPFKAEYVIIQGQFYNILSELHSDEDD